MHHSPCAMLNVLLKLPIVVIFHFTVSSLEVIDGMTCNKTCIHAAVRHVTQALKGHWLRGSDQNNAVDRVRRAKHRSNRRCRSRSHCSYHRCCRRLGCCSSTSSQETVWQQLSLCTPSHASLLLWTTHSILPSFYQPGHGVRTSTHIWNLSQSPLKAITAGRKMR